MHDVGRCVLFSRFQTQRLTKRHVFSHVFSFDKKKTVVLFFADFKWEEFFTFCWSNAQINLKQEEGL
jgi:hypothetical protein